MVKIVFYNVIGYFPVSIRSAQEQEVKELSEGRVERVRGKAYEENKLHNNSIFNRKKGIDG